MKKSLKIAFYTFLTLFILTFVCVFLIFSSPFFMNIYASTLIECSGVNNDNIYFQAYTKEEFALKYFNTSLSSEDDFLELFESHYGTENKKDGLFLVTYDIQEPGDKTRYILYGISKYTDLVYKDTRKVCYSDSEANLLQENRSSK